MGVVDGYSRFTLRLPEELRERVAKYAKENHRSINSEMLMMLREGCETREAKERKKRG